MIEFKENIKDLEKAIMKTIAFFDLFNYALTSFEIYKYLYGMQASFHEVREKLQQMRENLLIERNGFYALRDRVEIIENKNEQYHFTNQKLKIVRRVARILKYLPGIRMIALCNNFYYTPKSDIDLFIIVRRGELWTTRFFTTILMHILRLRRHGKQIADRVCLSFYITDDNLDLSGIALPEDPYFYYWLILLQPIYDTQVYREFNLANKWILQKLPNFSQNIFKKDIEDSKISKKFRKLDKKFHNSILQRKIENFFRIIQKRKMQANQKSLARHDDTRVLISDKILKFHEGDRREFYREKWQRSL